MRYFLEETLRHGIVIAIEAVIYVLNGFQDDVLETGGDYLIGRYLAMKIL